LAPDRRLDLAENIAVLRLKRLPGATLAAALGATPLASSLSDARRTIGQRAASVNGEVVPEDRTLTEADLLHGRWLVLRKGKRNYHLLDAAAN